MKKMPLTYYKPIMQGISFVDTFVVYNEHLYFKPALSSALHAGYSFSLWAREKTEKIINLMENGKHKT